LELLDVAGLVPGASEGVDLGNQFLNDLCGALALIHVIDATGRTNEQGEATDGHDPCSDVLWLHQEIQDWIFGNVHNKWGSMVRRHTARCAAQLNSGKAAPTVAESLQSLFSGYGSRVSTVQHGHRAASHALASHS
jgi:ribosome-binding ATPase YchF (GTP1/OBG family)